MAALFEKNEIRRVNEFSGTGRIFVHLIDGRTIKRVIACGECTRFAQIRSKEGIEAAHSYIAELMNTKYAEPNTFVKPTADDERAFLHASWLEIIEPR